MANEPTRDILTPGQAAEYLQVNRETVYRYIRQGKLAASRIGKSYRIPKRNIDLLLWSTRTSGGIKLREYSEEEIATFLEEDRLTAEERKVVERFEGKDDARARA